MTTILARDVLPDMVIRTMFEPGPPVGPVASATLRVASVDGHDGVVQIHADCWSSRIFEIPDHVKVQVLQWPAYAHETVDIDPEVTQSWHEGTGLDVGREALRKFMAEPNKANTLDTAIRTAFKPGGVTASCESIADQVEAAVERVLRRQQSKGQHPAKGAV